ncbi:probable mediator of RNA polymerase II transcription subunit 26c isoform X4 [Durio zibethinus]|uniref:Probable mediator of RNA polymerase II transcription subunit 26c isoform X4 n=1 Tax=Durio zibethinus TaxID=66656 RepID=A0A6P6AIZ2_DURZI|nr:probable mediator of RNA polymerase II transcription subunit 26c isoform X4 [Durio zibethinus]
MDLDDFRSVLEAAGVDVWTFIDTAILVASLDYGQELKKRRDGIVERLYATSMVSRCKSCDFGERSNGYQVNKEGSLHEGKGGEGGKGSPFTPQSDNEDDDLDPYGGLFDDEQKRVLEIKERLEVPDQSEDSLVELLQSLADMDITFQALKETDIGRHVNKLRKHSSNDVRRLVKQLVRNWKEIVDEWVRVNQPGELESAALMDGDSPQQKLPQNGRQQMGVLVQTRIIQNLKGSQSQSLLPEKILHLDQLSQLLHKMCRDRENKRKAILTLKSWLLQGKGFKKIIKKLKMVVGIKWPSIAMTLFKWFVSLSSDQLHFSLCAVTIGKGK